MFKNDVSNSMLTYSETKCKEGEAQDILDHLNAIEPGVIEFTKENQECDTLPVLDLKQEINRKTKKIECSVHYKKTHIRTST